MVNTYDNLAEAEADRAQQKLLLSALNATERALRRDECGAWAISGERGSVHTWGDAKTWALYVRCHSRQQWTWAKKKLFFCTVSQDADDDGVLRLHQLPTPDQACVIRGILGLQKRREVSAAALERLKAFAFELRPRSEAAVGANIGNGEVPRPNPHPGAIADNRPPVARACSTDEQGAR